MVRKPTTWSIKGIEEDTRDIARAAAERDEQTIGSWIDYAIRVHGGQRPREAGSDEKAAPETAPPHTVNQTTNTQTPAPGLTDQTVLDIIDRELDASTNRLDRALRPMGLALLDLAERMVSVEQERFGQARLGEGRGSENAGALGVEEAADDDFGPELPPQAEEELPEEPDELDPEIYDSAEQGALVEPEQAPPSPSHDLDPDFDTIDVPLLPGEETDRAREIDRRLRALAGEVDAVDAVDTDPPPPTGDLGPAEIVIDVPPPAAERAPDLELPMAFRGVQQTAFDSDPRAVASEDAQDMRTRRRRRVRGVLLGSTGLAVALAAGLYVFAGQVGLGPLRHELDSRLQPAAHNVVKGAAHIWDEAAARAVPMIDQARTALFGSDHPEEPETSPSDENEAPPLTEPVEPAQSANEEMPAAPDHAEQGTASAPAGAPQSGEREAEQPAMESQPPAPEAITSPTPDESLPETNREAVTGEVAPEPAPSEPPVPVPDAAPAPRVSEAPPPAPALSPRREKDPADTVASLPAESGLEKAEQHSLEQRADAGDAKAQHDLALAYLTGSAGTQNPERAGELLREAAIQGLPGAQYNLAVLYETGQGVRQDDVRALLWYHSAAEQGHPNAQYNLGVMYAEGRGIPLNFGEAARWFQAAAKQGMARALYNLAVMTDEGLGVPQDKKKALELFAEAADAGDQRAIEMLSGEMLSGRDGTGAENAPQLSGTEGVQDVADAPTAMVAAVQGELTRLGFYSGRVDGLIGPKTRAAIRHFEKVAGDPENGEVTEALLEKLKAAKP